MSKSENRENNLSKKLFVGYLIRSIVFWIICGVIGTLITYFFIDKTVVISPTNKTIIFIIVFTGVYIISAVVGWFVFIEKRNLRTIR